MKRALWIILLIFLVNCNTSKLKHPVQTTLQRDLVAVNEQLYQQQKQIELLIQKNARLEQKIALIEEDFKKRESLKPEETFRLGYEQFLKQQYSAAITYFDELLAEFSRPNLLEAALYFKARSLELLQQQKEAKIYYEIFLELFPASTHWEEVAIKLIKIYTESGEFNHAYLLANNFLAVKAESEFSALVKSMLNELKKKIRR